MVAYPENSGVIFFFKALYSLNDKSIKFKWHVKLYFSLMAWKLIIIAIACNFFSRIIKFCIHKLKEGPTCNDSLMMALVRVNADSLTPMVPKCFRMVADILKEHWMTKNKMTFQNSYLHNFAAF